jgi:hypothetical protein
MARNCGDHPKNFGLILRQGTPWNLTPAYGVTHAYNPKGGWTYQHLISVNQKFRDITMDDLIAVADRFGTRKPDNVLSALRAAIGGVFGALFGAGIARRVGLGKALAILGLGGALWASLLTLVLVALAPLHVLAILCIGLPSPFLPWVDHFLPRGMQHSPECSQKDRRSPAPGCPSPHGRINPPHNHRTPDCPTAKSA